MADGLSDAPEAGKATAVAGIHARFACRIHDLSEFMKTFRHPDPAVPTLRI
jgi:hypothetical protein